MTMMTCVTSDILTSVGMESSKAPNRRVVTTVSGRNIGYGSTCECLVQAGLVILQVRPMVSHDHLMFVL